MEQKVNPLKKSKFLGTTIIGKGNFLSLNEKQYEITNEKGEKKISKWECVDYNHILDNDMKNIKKPIVVSIIPIIKETKEIILINNFRYPIDKFCLEFPGGIIDKNDGEDILIATKKAAERELLEETGFKGKFKCYLGNNKLSEERQLKICSNIFYDPWKSKDNAVQCICEVEDNQNLNQNLDECEIIKVYKVKLNNLFDFIIDKIEKENCCVSIELYSFTCGLYLSQTINNELFN